MLSIGRIGAGDGYKYLASQVASMDEPRGKLSLYAYYERNGYPPGIWVGTGSRLLGIAAEVTEAQMAHLHGSGRHPETGEALGRPFPSPDQTTKAVVAGFDLTYSAPKSVSLLWALGGDEVRSVVAESHHLAVAASLAWIEEEVAATRVGHAGIAQLDVEGLLGVSFEHWFSRAGDPDLHSHVAVANRVRADDGVWRTLDSRALC